MAIIYDVPGDLETCRAALSDIAAQLHAHPDSVLTGEHGLAAATYRQAECAEELQERADALQGEGERLSALVYGAEVAL